MRTSTVSEFSRSPLLTLEKSASESSSAAFPILQGLMEGLGWSDQRAEIGEHDQKAHTTIQEMQTAFADYHITPNITTHAKLVAVLEKELSLVSIQYNYLREQQQQYQKQADHERAVTKDSSRYSWLGWGEYLINGVKQFFGSTAAQQAEKYASLAKTQQEQRHQLREALTYLTEMAVKEISPASSDSLELKETASSIEEAAAEETTPTLPMATLPQPHARRLLQQPVSDELLVNTYTLGAQWNANIRGLVNGDFVVAWQSEGQDGSGEGIYAQRYTAAGSPLDSEFAVNMDVLGDQEHSFVTALADGSFVISWMNMGAVMNGSMPMDGEQSSNTSSLYAQRYSSTGMMWGEPFQINTPSLPPMSREEEHFSVTASLTDDLVVAWQSGEEDLDVYVQQYAPNGTAIMTAFRANTYTLGDQQHPYVGILPNSDFVVVWASTGQDGSGEGIYAQKYSLVGSPLGMEFQINTYTSGDQKRPDIAVLTSGDFVVTWQSQGQDGSGEGIYARRYAPNGTALGDEFRVNTEMLGDQEHPVVSALTDGGFVFAWMNMGEMGGSMNMSMDGSMDDSKMAYVARRYSATGTALGDEFKVNTHPLEGQGSPSVSVSASGLADGRFAVAWTSDGPDGDKEGVSARIFTQPAEQKSSSSTSLLSSKDIAGIAVGGGIGVSVALILGLWSYNKKRKAKATEPKEVTEADLLKSEGIFAPPKPDPRTPTATEFASPAKSVPPTQAKDSVTLYQPA